VIYLGKWNYTLRSEVGGLGKDQMSKQRQYTSRVEVGSSGKC
jgi:hypothetical protein